MYVCKYMCIFICTKPFRYFDLKRDSNLIDAQNFFSVHNSSKKVMRNRNKLKL